MDDIKIEHPIQFETIWVSIDSESQLVDDLLKFEQAFIRYAVLESHLLLHNFIIHFVLLHHSGSLLLPLLVHQLAVLVDDTFIDEWL